jgi:MFS family permease
MKHFLRSHQIELPPALKKVFYRAAIFQVLITIGFEVVLVLGALSARNISGGDRIFGLATTTIFAVGQLVIALPVGKWMDKFGRRPVLLVGSIAETISLVIIGISLLEGSSVWFSISLIILGFGSGAAQMAYLIGGDIYPPTRRAEGLGLMTASIAVGIVAGPYLIGLIGDMATALHLDPLILPWFCLSLFTAFASWLMFGLHPEPLLVANNLSTFYGEAQDETGLLIEDKPAQKRGLRQLLRQYTVVASIGVMICFQGVRLSLIPLLTYILSARNYSLSLSSLMVAAMGLGMVLPSAFIGRLSDRLGRKKPLLWAIVIGGIGAGVLPLISSLVIMFILLVILGIAFSTALTVTRVMITDVTNSQERGEAMALNSIAIGIAVVLFPTISSYILSIFGWSAMSVVGIVLMVLAFIFTVALQESANGKWGAHQDDGFSV